MRGAGPGGRGQGARGLPHPPLALALALALAGGALVPPPAWARAPESEAPPMVAPPPGTPAGAPPADGTPQPEPAPADLAEAMRRIQSTCFALYPAPLLRRMSGSGAPPPEAIRDDSRAQVKYLRTEEKVARGLFYPSVLEDLLPALRTAIRPEARFLDLGSGDGRVVFLAALLGARAEGIEYDRSLHRIALEARGRLGDRVDPARAVLRRGDFFDADFRAYDVFFYFGSGTTLEADLLAKLRREMRPDAVLVLAYPEHPVEGFVRISDHAGVGLYRTAIPAATPPAAPPAAPSVAPPALPDPARSPAPPGAAPRAGLTERVTVTASRIPEAPALFPASVTVLGREELQARGVRDLRSALALAAGVDVAPGGDRGPAGAVPEIWGLREFDAVLLEVDGVPSGGAFNPALATLDLQDVERIEIVRGPAPVAYGTTSFSGVINVVHRDPGAGESGLVTTGGSHGSGGTAWRLPLPERAGLRSTLDADVERLGFRDDRAGVERGHLRWRAGRAAAGGTLRLGADGVWQRQEPASPVPLEGVALSPDIPLDANHNPRDAHLDERRLTLDAAFERPWSTGALSVCGSWSRSAQGILRGFLVDPSGPGDDAHGFREAIGTTDVTFDGHLTLRPTAGLEVAAGLDHLHGSGGARGGDFDYAVALDGGGAPSGDALPSRAAVRIRDHREFSGLYAQAGWTPAARWRLDVGARLNHTDERRATESLEFPTGQAEAGRDRRDATRGGSFAGLTFTPWTRGSGAVRLFVDYRDTFKPAAIDFGLDAAAAILAPETARSVEAGAKAQLLDERLTFTATAFRMDLRDLVVASESGGVPVLANAGAERFEGVELETAILPRPGLSGRLAWSLHDARYTDFVTDLDRVPTDLSGHRLEMVPRRIVAAGLVAGRATGLRGSLEVRRVGRRWLDRENSVPAPAYTLWGLGLGYRFRVLEVRVDGENLSDVRPPVSVSELGDVQSYLLPGRRLTLGLVWTPGS